MHRPLNEHRFRLLERVADGLSNKEIAHEFGISEQRVKDLVSDLLVQLDVPNRAALADALATYRILGHVHVAPRWRRFLFRDAPIGVAILEGPDHRIVAWNDAFQQAAGRELTGRPFADAFPEHIVCRARLDRVFTSGRAETGEVALQPLPDDHGEPAGVAMYVTSLPR